MTGLLGINVGDIPLTQQGGHGFWIVCGVCVIILGLELALLRKLKWF